MPHTTLPTETDLSALLYSAGMIAAPATSTQAQADYATAITAASDEWNRVTGYKPFLANAADVLRKFDPPGPMIRGTRYGYRSRGGERFLEFEGCGLVSLTSVTTGVDNVSAGTVRTLGTDFYLYPANAVAENTPYTRIEFVLPVYGSQQSVQVLGKWGFSATLPDDAWSAILRMAALELVPSLELGKFGGLKSWKDSDASETYGDSPFSGVTEQWRKQINRAKMNYVRL